MSIKSKVRRFLPAAAIGVLIVAALGVATATLQSGQTAHAQSNECIEYYACVTKIAPGGGNTDFLFQVEIDEGVSPFDSQTLEDGDTFGLYFKRKAVIREIPTAGWRLLSVSCEGNIDIEYIQGGVILEVPKGIEVPTADCVFRNARIEDRPLNLGGLFSGQPTPLPTAPSAVAPAATAPVITPPRTGDAGLK